MCCDKLKIPGGWLMLLGIMIWPSVGAAVACNPAGTQIEMNACAADSLRQADLELNNVYQALIKKYQQDKIYMNNLRAAQRAWLRFRDAELEAMFSCDVPDKRLCWGSLLGVLYPAAQEVLTRERTKRLQKYLEQGKNSAVDERGEH